MSPIIKKKGEKFTLPSKYLLFILTILCTAMMLITFGTDAFNRPLNTVVGYVIIPFQRGIGRVGEGRRMAVQPFRRAGSNPVSAGRKCQTAGGDCKTDGRKYPAATG